MAVNQPDTGDFTVMHSSFYSENRSRLYDSLPDGTLLAVYSGSHIRKTADEDYIFYADTNFLYLTGIEQVNSVLIAVKRCAGDVSEVLFLLPSDLMAERWTGRRLTTTEAYDISGCKEIKSTSELDNYVKTAAAGCNTLALDLDDMKANNASQLEFQARMRSLLPDIAGNIHDVRPQLRAQRTIKAPCEIEAMRIAESITRDGIVAMMRASKPGMYEYEYRAEFDYALAKRGCVYPAFPPIISAGANNFCIHYYGYMGRANDGDMILNDVGAKYDHMHTDVSRGFPCNGKFSPRQRALYECAYETSNHMFEILKPGLPMKFVDEEIHRYCSQLLCDIGLLDKPENKGRYMWHGGAHHVGFDTHDMVDARGELRSGMVFCVDVGIYVEEWGIGFRLEDNCLITEDGCENLSACTPRSIDEIESIMRG